MRSKVSPWIASFAYLLVLFAQGSVSLAASAAGADQALIQSVVVLDGAISALSRPAADYRKILEAARSALPGNDSGAIRAGIARFLSRLPVVGTEFKCAPDFLRHRALKELVRLKDSLPDSKVEPGEPQACYAVPFAVDAARAPGKIDIYGFDLDRVNLEMFLISRDGFHDVSFALSRKNHYHVTLDLGAGGAQLSPDSNVLGLTWGHLIRYSIPIIQPATPVCQSRIEEIATGKSIVYPPLRILGDRAFPGRDAKVWASVMVDHESNKVDATVCMTAMSEGKAPTIFNGCGGEYVYTTEPERVIERVFGELESDIKGGYGAAAAVVRDGVAGGPVSKWRFAGLGDGPLSKQDTQVTVELGKLRVVSTEASNDCVSAIAYMEAKRGNALGRDAIERLDAKLKDSPVDILILRPRFAPEGR